MNEHMVDNIRHVGCNEAACMTLTVAPSTGTNMELTTRSN